MTATQEAIAMTNMAACRTLAPVTSPQASLEGLFFSIAFGIGAGRACEAADPAPSKSIGELK